MDFTLDWHFLFISDKYIRHEEMAIFYVMTSPASNKIKK